MRKFALLLGITFISFLARSQTKFLPTTEEEYNYLSKGIKVMRDAGLDVKKGYWLHVVSEGSYNINNVQYKTEVIGLFTEDQSTIKGFSFHYTTDKFDRYIALPVKSVIPQTSLRSIFFNNIASLQYNDLLIYSMMLSDLLALGKS